MDSLFPSRGICIGHINTNGRRTYYATETKVRRKRRDLGRERRGQENKQNGEVYVR